MTIETNLNKPFDDRNYTSPGFSYTKELREKMRNFIQVQELTITSDPSGTVVTVKVVNYLQNTDYRQPESFWSTHESKHEQHKCERCDSVVDLVSSRTLLQGMSIYSLARLLTPLCRRPVGSIGCGGTIVPSKRTDTDMSAKWSYSWDGAQWRDSFGHEPRDRF